MGRTLDEVLASLPADRRSELDRRSEALRERADALAQLSGIADSASAALDGVGPLRSPDHAARFLLELARAVEVAGGSVDLLIRLPGRPDLGISDLADAATWVESAHWEGPGRIAL